MKISKNKSVKKYQLGGAIPIQLGLSALQAGLGAYQMSQGNKALKSLKAPSTAAPSEWRELYKNAMDQQLMQRQLEEINRSTATSIQALQGAGGRAILGGLPGVNRAAERAQFETIANQNQLQQSALQNLTSALEREQGRERTVYEQRAGEARGMIEGGLQNIAGAFGGAGKSIVASQFNKTAGKKAGETTASEGKMPGTTLDEYMAIPLAEEQAASIMSPADAYQQGFDYEGVTGVSDVYVSPEILREQEMKKRLLEQLGLNDRAAYMKEGGMMTKGSFNHKTNPIDIIQKGEKIGEMTGGEVILNPQQAARLSKENAYFRTLLKKFNKRK